MASAERGWETTPPRVKKGGNHFVLLTDQFSGMLDSGRRQITRAEPIIYHFNECELDDQLYQLRRKGAVIEMEPKVFAVLAYLLQHCDRVVSKEELRQQLWPGQVTSEAALIYCIVEARKAVGDDGRTQHIIKTQHGRGDRFVAGVVSSQ